MTTYKIIRFYAPHRDEPSKTIATGLSLEEAQDHCSREETHEAGEWFDGFQTET